MNIDRKQRLIKKLALVTPTTSQKSFPTLSAVQQATLAQVLESEAKRPLRGKSADMQHDGLFGDGFKQRELF